MRGSWFAALAVMGLAVAAGQAAPIIDVGTIEAMPDALTTFAIRVAGGDLVQGVDLYIQIGDGGTANGGVDTRPILAAVDIVGPGTIFAASDTGQRAPLASNLLRAASTTTDPAVADRLAADGILAFVTIDTTGTARGQTYPLRLTGVAAGVFGEPGMDTAFAGVPAQITDGTIRIIPEPATIALLSGAIAGLRRRRPAAGRPTGGP